MSHLAINEQPTIKQIIPLAQLVNYIQEIPPFGAARFKGHMKDIGLQFDHVDELIDTSLVFNTKGEPRVEVEIYLDETKTETGIVGITFDDKTDLYYADVTGLQVSNNSATV